MGGTAYRYVVRTGSAGDYRYTCGRLPRVELPDALAALNFQYEAAGALHPYSTRYVALDLDDCGARGTSSRGAHAHLFVLDTVNQTIVWYLDMVAMTGLVNPAVTGWRYQPATATAPDRLFTIVDRRYLYEWGFDGTLRNFVDLVGSDECSGTSGASGPCAHHDAFADDDGARTSSWAAPHQRPSQTPIGRRVGDRASSTTATRSSTGRSSPSTRTT